MNSGPLSTRITSGVPRHSMSLSSSLVIRLALNEVSMGNHQSFSIVIIYHVEGAEQFSITQAIMHEIRTPSDVALDG